MRRGKTAGGKKRTKDTVVHKVTGGSKLDLIDDVLIIPNSTIRLHCELKNTNKKIDLTIRIAYLKM